MFGLKLHIGSPKHPTEVRAWTGALGSAVGGVERPWSHCFTTHEIGRWYGISFKRVWFVGFMRVAKSLSYRTQEPPKTGVGSEI